MTRVLSGIVVVTCGMWFASALAQDQGKMPEMTPEQKAEMEAYQKAGTPGAPHQTLAKQAGAYDAKVKMWHEPGGPAMEESGTTTRMMTLDGRVMVEDFSCTMMGMPYTGHGMTGYDNVTKKWWSTWNDNMSTGLMIAEGTCDAQGACTFTGTSSDAVRKKPMKTRMTSKWTDASTEVFTMYGPDHKGKEFKMMEITYTKK